MIRPTVEERNRILEMHRQWIAGDSDGKQANLRGADLHGAHLEEANFGGADLQGTNLQRANLWGANLRWANLRRADLRGTNLWGANLQGADFREANLEVANLGGSDLQGANLQGANLRGTDLQVANLREANLKKAYFGEASLRGADLGNTVVVQSGPLGSRKDYLVTIWHPEWESEQVTAGCWRGTLDELEKRVASVHGDSYYGRQYKAAIAYHRAMVEEAR